VVQGRVMFEDVTTALNGCLTETGLLTQATARAAHPREWRGRPPQV